MLKWPPPSKDKTSLESKRLFSPAPDDLRALVFDYLWHSSFTETARAFVKDSAVRHIDDDGDDIMGPDNTASRDVLADTLDERLKSAELRRDIRIHILSGRVDAAIELLHTHFPGVLPQDSITTASLPSTSDLKPPSNSFTYDSDTSVDPTHLLLNLRILGFIETARTVPLPYNHPGTSASASSSRTYSPAASEVRGETDDPELSEQQLLLLHKAQKLYWEANCLPQASDRALYLKELGQVTSLLAYTNPENSIMAPYLAQDRREAVADQIERAIFHRLGQSSVSHIEVCTRYTTALWGALHYNDISLPPKAKWPPGVEPPPTSPSSDYLPPSKHIEGDKTPSGKKAEKESERAPLFSLAEFLNAKV